MHFTHPEPPHSPCSVFPVFLPFQGCPERCIYCSQVEQTGQAPMPLEAVYTRLESALSEAADTHQPPMELGFFGGTFTALPGDWAFRFLSLAAAYHRFGLLTRVRCSTRPDAVTPELLAQLAAAGLHMVEFGVQSFQKRALVDSRRGYTSEQALSACRMVAEAGLELGVQLMPGMPGSDPEDLDRDIETTLSTTACAVRLYPCMVLEHTPLADLWRRGAYTPWTMEEAVPRLARATLRCWRAGVRVIRTGLAPEPDLERSILAGPHHPALGQSIRSHVLLDWIRRHVDRLEASPLSLEVPRRHAGELWGHRAELRESYAALGITPANTSFVDSDTFLLR